MKYKIYKLVPNPVRVYDNREELLLEAMLSADCSFPSIASATEALEKLSQSEVYRDPTEDFIILPVINLSEDRQI